MLKFDHLTTGTEITFNAIAHQGMVVTIRHATGSKTITLSEDQVKELRRWLG